MNEHNDWKGAHTSVHKRNHTYVSNQLLVDIRFKYKQPNLSSFQDRHLFTWSEHNRTFGSFLISISSFIRRNSFRFRFILRSLQPLTTEPSLNTRIQDRGSFQFHWLYPKASLHSQFAYCSHSTFASSPFVPRASTRTQVRFLSSFLSFQGNKQTQS